HQDKPGLCPPAFPWEYLQDNHLDEKSPQCGRSTSSNPRIPNCRGKDGTHREAAAHRDHWLPPLPSASDPSDKKDQRLPKTPIAASHRCFCPSPTVPYKTAPTEKDPLGSWRRCREQRCVSLPVRPVSPFLPSSAQNPSSSWPHPPPSKGQSQWHFPAL